MRANRRPLRIQKTTRYRQLVSKKQDRHKRYMRQEKDGFDVFLCHHSADKSEVKKIGKQLIKHGLRPWLDEWELRPGFPWQRLLERVIEKIEAAAVFVGPSGIGPWQQWELEAYLREFVRRECPVIPVLLPGVSKAPHLPVFLAGLTWVDFRDSEPDPLRRLIWGITGERIGSRIKPSPASIVRKAPYQGFRDHLKDHSEAPEMVYLPGGTFRMGDIQGKGDEDERPVHEVTLDTFAIARHPVTVGEFRRFIKSTGYQTEAEQQDGAFVWDGKEWGKKSDANWRNPYMTQDDDHPLVCVSWNDAAAYCEWLSQQTAEQYSLPTEAQWEYACRASSETAYCFGGDQQRLGEYAWYSENSEGKTHPVEQKRANQWGLYDMHGNVWEWVHDWYGDYSKQPQSNPSGPEWGSVRVVRGGSWFIDAVFCRSAFRSLWFDPGDRVFYLGFRLARRV
jgi:formylglycine-generating enzyme required for sulfatase activity